MFSGVALRRACLQTSAHYACYTKHLGFLGMHTAFDNELLRLEIEAYGHWKPCDTVDRTTSFN